MGHFQLYSVLVLGHTEHDGVQHALLYPFKDKLFHGANSQYLVFVCLPSVKEFHLSMEIVWFCKVLLQFSFETMKDAGTKQHPCALVSVLWEYELEGLPGDLHIIDKYLDIFRRNLVEI